MKKIILIIALVVSPALAFGQSMFDKLEDMDDVTSVILSKDAFEILSKFNADSMKDSEIAEVFTMIQDLNEFKMFTSEKPAIAEQMNTMVKSAVKSRKLIELMRIKDKGSRVLIYVKSTKNKDYVSEVLMFVKGIDKRTNGMAEAVVLSLTGNIDINKMSRLADTFAKSSNIKIDRKK